MMSHGEIANFVLSVHKSTRTLHAEKMIRCDEPILTDHGLQCLNDVVKWASEIVKNEVELR